MSMSNHQKDSRPPPDGGNVKFDVKQYCEENKVEVKDMYFD